ncbi:cysteine synthase A [Spirulina sp. CS-785/01]|uniref:cysteine synthase A n=1 Tax=Spirulina sp. CS-785/01 TaxID=3021716 RepID=UPI00233137C2|nr:cysteine synthase A [Spirulina sp. CS-785/01]MDB9312859.1 cysteine synthase A [Spirulina sp. CS-785/01]
MKIYNNITEVIGNTPIVQLKRLALADKCEAEVYLKLESFNPAKSVKDRIAISMIEEAEASGLIQPQQSTIIEATSGNTGIGLAMVCAAKGYALILTMPDNMSQERRQLLKAYGAKVMTTPAELDMGGAIARANELLASISHSFSPQQFSNPANPKIHYTTTGPEIWTAMEEKVDILVTGVGTGGTLTGAGRFLKRRNPDLKIIAVEPEKSAVLSGKPPHVHDLQGIGAGFIPDVLRVDLIDEIFLVTEDQAYQMGRRLAKEEGVMSGISSGATVYAGIEVAKRLENAHKRLVIIQASGGERYLSTPLFH